MTISLFLWLSPLLLIPLCAFFDRLEGGWPQVPGRGIYYAAPIMGVIGAFLAVVAGYASIPVVASIGGSFALCYYFTRGLGWEPGSLNPDEPPETWGTLVRHSFALLFMLPIWLLGGHWLYMLAYPVIATGLAWWNGRSYLQGRDINGKIEVARGAALGAVLAAALTPLYG